MSNFEYVSLEIERSALPDVLRGVSQPQATPFNPHLQTGPKPGKILVLWEGRSLRPSIIVAQSGERDELYSWIFTYARDLAPLTSWCHVVSHADLASLTTRDRWEANLGGFEAAWTGAIIAELMLLSKRSFDTISLPPCLATEGFAIGRMAALYGARAAARDVLPQLAMVRSHFQKDATKAKLAPGSVTDILLRLLPDPPTSFNEGVELVVEACRALHAAQGHLQDDSPDAGLPSKITDQFERQVPQLGVSKRLQEFSAEDRVRLLREIRNWTSAAEKEDVRLLLTFAAGYVVSRVGGAERDLRLADSFGEAAGDVLTWAAVVGGLGAQVYWTNAFGGLGRLVARELSRPLHAADPPTADIAADELSIIESQRSGGRREFRPSSRSAIAVSLRPGIVIQIGISEDDRGRGVASDTGIPTTAQNNARPSMFEPGFVQAVAEQLRPYVRELVGQEISKPQGLLSKRGNRKPGSPQLPLKR